MTAPPMAADHAHARRLTERTRSARLIRDTIGLLSSKWSVDVLLALGDGTRRYHELLEDLAPISEKVLSQTLTRQQLSAQMNNFGLGLALSGAGNARTFGHNGRDEGFDAQMLAFAETGQGVVIMINANDNSRMMSLIVDFVARRNKWPQRAAA